MSERIAAVRGKAWWIGLWALLLLTPLFLERFWMSAGLFAMAAAIGAIGLTILTGTTGQLSLAHAFFVAIGAYGYCYFAGGETLGIQKTAGLGLPPIVALVLAVLLAGIAGALFSPIAGRLRGIYLGIASIGLVFIGQHILFNATELTGGFNGRDAEPFSLAGFNFTPEDPVITIAGVTFTELEKLWYLGLVLVAIAYWFARNIVRNRPGRALETVRDSEVAAAVMGVDVTRYKAAAFTVSSMYAGLAGVLFALAFGRIVPNSFGFALSVEFLVMIVIGGLGSVGGAVTGAVFVSLLPRVLEKYSDALPLLAEPGQDGVTPSQAARYAYGAAIIAVLLYLPGGLAGLRRRLSRRKRRRGRRDGATERASTPTAREDMPPLRSTEVKEPAP